MGHEEGPRKAMGCRLWHSSRSRVWALGLGMGVFEWVTPHRVFPSGMEEQLWGGCRM